MARKLLTGQVVQEVSEEWKERVGKDLQEYKQGVVRILPEGWIYPGVSPFFLDKLQQFQFRTEDVVVMGYPKCGSTWVQETVWTMMNNPDLTNPHAEEGIWNRSLEISSDMLMDVVNYDELGLDSIIKILGKMCPGKSKEDGFALQMLEVMPGPRIMKCHYAFELMPLDFLDKTKVIYVLRNPKDTVVSFYHYVRIVRLYDYKGSFEKFAKEFINDQMLFGPYWPHVHQAWRRRSHPNLHLIFYEDLKADFMTQLHLLDKFLGTNLGTQQMQNVQHITEFTSMKSKGTPITDTASFNQSIMEKEGGFYRKGVAGDWKNTLSPELNQEMDKWIKDNIGDIPIKWDDEKR
ncbi:hypothetical protein Pcinc_022990 [Petrolisthes cinctipes]|uniref:Sulfotransferase domain-containing protein n=1 Tax=Petrolisthes cinctipes TaxID=88211 RepID=A0AAE1FCN4_PETCI|nr:hypothetical protein Pcinc_022990 [Petrolisthes cinctipes]